jgi:glycosyltransferase involved in cell wall biosynthesis
MKILQVTPSFPPSTLGGVSTHVDLISRGLTSRGHSVSVATTNRLDLKHVMAASGIRETGGLRVYYAKAHWPGRYFLAPGILRVLEQWIPEFDIIHVHDTRTFVGLAAYMLTRRLSVPYVLTCHGSLSVKVGDTVSKVLHDRVLGKGLVKNASRVIAVSAMEVRDFAAFGIPPERILVIPNSLPLDETVLYNRPSSRNTRNGTEQTVLFLGRIHPIKGIDRLIEAFGLVRQRNTTARLLIVGQDYGARDSLKKIARRLNLQDVVEFRGPASGPDKKALLENADVLVLPSRSEVFGLVILEAFASRLPVIATDGCSIAADLERAHAGLIVSSVGEMADAIEHCLSDRDLANSLTEGGLRLLRTTYDWQAVMAKLEEAYSQAILSGSNRER